MSLSRFQAAVVVMTAHVRTVASIKKTFLSLNLSLYSLCWKGEKRRKFFRTHSFRGKRYFWPKKVLQMTDVMSGDRRVALRCTSVDGWMYA